MTVSGLPDFSHQFTVDVVGEQTEKRWVGSFTYTKPSIGINGAIARHHSMLDGGMKIDPDQSFIHYIMAFLRHTLSDYPKWWSDSDFGSNFYDMNVILDMYKKCIQFEEDVAKKIGEKASANKSRENKVEKNEDR